VSITLTRRRENNDAAFSTLVTVGTTAGAVTIGLLWAVVDRQRRSLQHNIVRMRVVYSRPTVG
jgi:hypothetical protein